MSQILSARGVVIDSLRKIGAYTTADSGPDSVHLEIGLSALDTVLGHKLATTRFTFMTPETMSLALTAEQQDYDLKTELGGAWPPDGIMMPVSIHLLDGISEQPQPIAILRRDQWEALDHSQSGAPQAVYFDRSDNSTITARTWPTLGAGLTGYSLSIVAQKFAPRVSGTGLSANVPTGLPQSFNMWGIYELSAFLGDGTIRRLPASTVKEYREVAILLWSELMPYAAAENADDVIAEPWGM